MQAVADLDYWTQALHATARTTSYVNPLEVFNEGECGAWVATLRALRALPSQRKAPRAPADRAIEQAGIDEAEGQVDTLSASET
jgi:hypothetical protein